ncbi:MAG TPA: YeeE/YedE family protein [Alphaproteobacteria bacterium]|nr:YeeE/YedE family protein [Alphaproteobacteria bacterium]
MSVNALTALFGFAIGLVFGAAAQRTNFCTMGAVSDLVLMGDSRRMRAWLLAIAVAILGSAALHLAGAVDLGKSIYLTANFGWLGAVVGGLMFGFGMVLAGGCGSRTLVRLGAGNLKALVVILVLGVAAYMTLRGLIAVVRVGVIEPTNIDLRGWGLASQGLPEAIASMSDIEPTIVRAIVALGAGGGLFAFALADPKFRAARAQALGAAAIGATIPAGWLATGVLGADDFEPAPLASLTFVAPVGDSLVYLMTFSGASITFGIGAVGGVIAGAAVAAVASGTYRLESFTDARDMLRHLAGGAAMGVGGVLALGCTIGQGITGLSTLALGSLIAFVSIVGGAVYALKYLEEGTLLGALRALAART